MSTSVPVACLFAVVVLATSCLVGCSPVQQPVTVDYDDDTNEKQVWMCVDLAVEVAGWVDEDNVHATVPATEAARSGDVEGTLALDGKMQYEWACEVGLAAGPGFNLAASLTRFEPVEEPDSDHDG
ncbi:hypothetical protein ACFQ58_02655 [Agromyces sp. NPDC056523]|uniref:hypothetical protein n=1 Tax=Agromyces sp. NPDC056523 TaxID=3345850 RepID=UPI00366A8491